MLRHIIDPTFEAAASLLKDAKELLQREDHAWVISQLIEVGQKLDVALPRRGCRRAQNTEALPAKLNLCGRRRSFALGDKYCLEIH